jgi:hypothetical protein
MAAKWGLPPMEWTPPRLAKDGMHLHIEEVQRVGMYRRLTHFINAAWDKSGPVPTVALCKESRGVREAIGLVHYHCNCE